MSRRVFELCGLLLGLARIVAAHPHADIPLGEADFACNGTQTSAEAPASVHLLRPGDVGVVAALGDSLTAGYIAKLSVPRRSRLEYRGISFSMGTDGDLSQMVTLPNILRQFNADVRGGSVGEAAVGDELRAGLNVAVSGAITEDLVGQARRLIDRLRSLDGMDFDRDWKIVTIFIGTNDARRYCLETERYSSANFTQHLRQVIDILRENIPRLLLQVVALNAQDYFLLDAKSLVCDLVPAGVETPCCVKGVFNYAVLQRLVHQYQVAALRLEEEFASAATGDQFALVVQPFFQNTLFYISREGGFNNFVTAYDRFHWSEKGHAIVARWLWNNMLEASGNKTIALEAENATHLICPDPECPYIRTWRNSQPSCGELGVSEPLVLRQEDSENEAYPWAVALLYWLLIVGSLSIAAFVVILGAKRRFFSAPAAVPNEHTPIVS